LVVNASPLIALARIGQLVLLERLPAELFVPPAVVEEILGGPDDPARRALESGWGQRRFAAVPETVGEWGLGKGESGVIALAMEIGATAVLDDRSARSCAKAFDVPVLGTLGVVIAAKQRGVVELAGPIIQSLLAAGLYYDHDSARRLLEAIGESLG
jgi:predicted nucleic acid-binding protein